MEWYIIINRDILQEYGINWAQTIESALTYEDICALFDKQKTALLQSMPGYNKTVIKDEKDFIQVEISGDNLPVFTRILKIIPLY